MAEPEFMSCFSVALSDDLGPAKKQSHDNVIAGAGMDRLSGVAWTFHSTNDAPTIKGDGGMIEMPPDVVELCREFPGHTLVMATVRVRPL